LKNPALVVAGLAFWWFSLQSEATSENGSVTFSKSSPTPITNKANSPISTTQPSASAPLMSMLDGKIQLNYSKAYPEVKTVGDLISHIKRTISNCQDTEKEIADGVLTINPSISKNLGKDISTISSPEVLAFKLEDISGSVTFAVSSSCDLSIIDPVNFKSNGKKRKNN
jgi:hypothetical protein